MVSYKFCPYSFFRALVLGVVGLLVFGGILVQAANVSLQANAPKKSEEPVTPQQNSDPLKRPRTKKQEQAAERVLPRVPPSDGKPASFKQEQKLNLWMQVYNLGLDGRTGKPFATVRYEIVDTGTGQSVVDFTQSTQEMGSAGGQVTLEKSLHFSKLAPGNYQITVRVDDLVSKQTISPTAKFTVQ
ncbi:MAG TPA: hypothetical protein VJ723_10720 [Candidatus Angelobacter sp.]|nr:hypothetical protein [Candidatus Angelobacter sp.]